MKVPKHIYYDPTSGWGGTKRTSEDDVKYYSENCIPDERSIVRIAMKHTTDGDNADLIFRAFKAGLQTMKNIITK